MIVMLINLVVIAYYPHRFHLQVVIVHKLVKQYVYKLIWIVNSSIQNVKQYQKINVNISWPNSNVQIIYILNVFLKIINATHKIYSLNVIFMNQQIIIFVDNFKIVNMTLIKWIVLI